jgi:hypothetical protein
MKRILIVNRDGLLSALPTVPEYLRLDFQNDTERFLIGAVQVTDAVATAIQSQTGRVRVLMPELPPPLPESGWLYVAVVNGALILAEKALV